MHLSSPGAPHSDLREACAMASGSHVWLNVACSTSWISSRLLLRYPVAFCTEILSTGAEVHIAETRLSGS